MSRIIVKNLPKTITEEQLRQKFGTKGLLTDIQLKYASDGKFRQFAFLGYQNEEEAKEAIKFFDKTFIKTSKISVEPCEDLGNKKAKIKPTVNDTENEKSQTQDPEETHKDIKEKDNSKTANQKTKTLELLEQYKDDPDFEEFMQVHAPKELQLLNATKTSDPTSLNEDTDEPDPEQEKLDKTADQEISDLDYMKMLMKTNKKRERTEKKVKEKIKLFTVKLRDLPYTCKKKDIKEFFKPNKPFTIRLPRGIKGIAYVGFKTEKQCVKALQKDRSFISGKRVSVIQYATQETPDSSNTETDPKQRRWKTQEESLKNEEDIGESGRIFVRNLAYTTNEDDIQELFSKYGPLSEVNLPIDSASRKLKGFGTLTFLMPEHAVKAYTELDGTVLHGRMLHLLPGKTKDLNDNDNETTNYKQKKSKKQKAEAGSAHNWNSLFLGHNAVAEVIANTFGTSKKNVLDPHGDSSAAVRLALGETQIVASTREFLKQEGVILDAFSTLATKRSKTTILIKNLPANTEAKEIRDIFQVHGVLGRVILPPNAITAIVEFVEPSEARKAFTRLAYSKFKNIPLYLEWAPENSLMMKVNDLKMKVEDGNDIKNTPADQKSDLHLKESHDIKEDDKQTAKENVLEDEEEEEPEPDTTLFIKNLNFETTDDVLHKHFESCGKIHYATVATKKDVSNPRTKLSMGFGFVCFMLKSSADKAMKTLQQSVLDGKSLELKRSERALRNETVTLKKKKQNTKQTGSKILVRNIPFQATRKEIMELFKTFGEIRALRLPKKMTVGEDSHRGFAFVDYVTASDAKKAFEALSQSTHLYGRRLVLEWATVDNDIEQIRKRTADHFHSSEEHKSKKSVFNLE